MKRVALQVVGPLSKDLPGFNVVLHHRLHTELLNRADLHADPTAQVARHDRATALEDQLVLFDASVPDLLVHQRTACAALHADLSYLAESEDDIVDRLGTR